MIPVEGIKLTLISPDIDEEPVNVTEVFHNAVLYNDRTWQARWKELL